MNESDSIRAGAHDEFLAAVNWYEARESGLGLRFIVERLMSSITLSDRLARTFAVLRGVMLVLFSAVLLIAPEKAMPGSSSEPAHSLAVMFASRTILLGVAFAVLAVRATRKGLAWLFLADAALQLFDTGMALVTHKGALAALPVMIGGLEVWAGVVLLRLGSVDTKSALATNRSGPM